MANLERDLEYGRRWSIRFKYKCIAVLVREVEIYRGKNH